jgi:hypothetical protein
MQRKETSMYFRDAEKTDLVNMLMEQKEDDFKEYFMLAKVTHSCPTRKDTSVVTIIPPRLL